MSQCPNCGATLSCGCQMKTLPNGKKACSQCINKPVNNDQTPQPSNTD